MNIFKRLPFLSIVRYLRHLALAEFIDRAWVLIVDVEALANRFHARSSQHEMLLWEIDAIEVKVNFLVNGSEIPSHLATSALGFLLTQSADAWSDTDRAILLRMQAFHRDFEDLKREMAVRG